MRLIDADALEQKLGMLGVGNAYDRPSFWYGKDKKDYKVIPTKYHNGYDDALADVEKAIQEMPTIEERKKGEWIISGNEEGNWNAVYKCSLCSHSDVQAKSQKVPYCWWCGAEMVKEGAEE